VLKALIAGVSVKKLKPDVSHESAPAEPPAPKDSRLD